MDRGQDAFFNAEALKEHLGDRGQAVGGATGIGDHMVFAWVILLVVDPHADGDIFAFGRRANDDLLRPCADVQGRFFLGGKKTSALHHDVNA